MKIITIQEVAAKKRADILCEEANRKYVGNAVADQRIDYIRNMSDEDYMNMYNEVVRRELRKEEAAKAKRDAISAERKATGISKKAYRAEYDRLMAEYRAGNYEAKAEAKKIQKFAF